MCGFIIFYKEDIDSKELKERSIKALKRINHRGPDYNNSLIKNKISFSHSRLSILDTSSKGNQPLETESGRYIIVFNGEIYNHNKLREIYLKGELLGSNNDTVTIAHLIERYDIKFTLSILEGMFSIAIYDSKTKEIFLARDINGEKPLYLGLFKKSFCVTSDLNVVKDLGIETSFNKNSIDIFLQTNNIPAPLTIYKEFKKLIPGQVLKIDTQKISIKNIKLTKNKSKNKTSKLNIKNYQENVESCLKSVLRDYVVSDRPLAFFLSGGIDSSLLTAIAAKEVNQKIDTYSVSFEDEEFDESYYSRKISKELKTNHKEIIFSNKKIESLVDKLISCWGEPFGDSSSLPLLVLSEKVSANHIVAISGDGGDELFFGYNRYKFLNSKVIKLINKSPKFLKNKIIKHSNKLLPLFQILRLRFPTQKIEKLQKSLQENNNLVYKYKTFINNSPLYNYREKSLEKIISKYLKNIDIKNDYLENIRNLDLSYYMPNDILQKVDICSMACSLEVRAPFLDPRVKELADSVPINFHINKGEPKKILKNILEKYISKDLIYRPKMGFGVSISSFILKKNIKNYIFFNLKSEEFYSKYKTNKKAFFKNIEFLYSSLERNNKSTAVYILWNLYILCKWLEKN